MQTLYPFAADDGFTELWTDEHGDTWAVEPDRSGLAVACDRALTYTVRYCGDGKDSMYTLRGHGATFDDARRDLLNHSFGR